MIDLFNNTGYEIAKQIVLLLEVAAPPAPEKNVAIFDDFISSNNTNDDFDEITATLGDVDAYIELQQKQQGKRDWACNL